MPDPCRPLPLLAGEVLIVRWKLQRVSNTAGLYSELSSCNLRWMPTMEEEDYNVHVLNRRCSPQYQNAGLSGVKCGQLHQLWIHPPPRGRHQKRYSGIAITVCYFFALSHNASTLRSKVIASYSYRSGLIEIVIAFYSYCSGLIGIVIADNSYRSEVINVLSLLIGLQLRPRMLVGAW
jgi:hypothetical protein